MRSSLASSAVVAAARADMAAAARDTPSFAPKEFSKVRGCPCLQASPSVETQPAQAYHGLVCRMPVYVASCTCKSRGLWFRHNAGPQALRPENGAGGFETELMSCVLTPL